jgi:hypothetical protein
MEPVVFKQIFFMMNSKREGWVVRLSGSTAGKLEDWQAIILTLEESPVNEENNKSTLLALCLWRSCCMDERMFIFFTRHKLP